MKFLPLRDFEDVTSALNFDTADCHVVGGCDLYTTKAAGSDKKLYKNIENTLESQHASLLRLSASLSPPQQETLADSLNLSRSSPFGPLSQISSRRTFAYLIATLNASHPDYDFSHILRPSDFRRERALRSVMQTIDTTLNNLRSRPTALLAVPSNWASGPMPSGLRTPGGTPTWGPRMWRLIDNEMSLRECAVYCYAPEEDPFDGDEGAIWSMNYFFFNKDKKRVCYLYLRGLSVISHSPIMRPIVPDTPKRVRDSAGLTALMTSGARKRAKYWLGNRADGEDVEGGWGEEDEDVVIEEPGDDGVDIDEPAIDFRDAGYERSRAKIPQYISSDDDDEMEDDDDDDEDEEDDMDTGRKRHRSTVRAMSEDMADEMEF